MVIFAEARRDLCGFASYAKPHRSQRASFGASLGVELFFEFGVALLEDRFAGLTHQGQVVVEVVQRGEAEVGELLRAEEVVDVGAAVAPAGRAVALRIDGALVVLVLRPFDIDLKRVPLRALRVGMTQSNMSMPRSMFSIRSSGVPTPIR